MLKTITLKNTWSKRQYWWWNWYVVLPKWHKYYGVNYNDIPVDIHGWLTYWKYWNEYIPGTSSDEWVIWFDTSHFWDNQENRNEEFVKKETENLRNQIELLSKE